MTSLSMGWVRDFSDFSLEEKGLERLVNGEQFFLEQYLLGVGERAGHGEHDSRFGPLIYDVVTTHRFSTVSCVQGDKVLVFANNNQLAQRFDTPGWGIYN